MSEPTKINGLDGMWMPHKELSEKWASGEITTCPQCNREAAGLPWGGSMRCEFCDDGVGISFKVKPMWFVRVKE